MPFRYTACGSQISTSRDPLKSCAQARAGKCRPALFCVFLFYPFGICPDKAPDNLRILFYWFGRRLIAWPGSVRELLNRAGAASDTERCAGRTLCTNNAGNVRKTCDFVQKNDQNARFPCKSHAFSIKKRALSAGNHFRQNRGGPCVILSVLLA